MCNFIWSENGTLSHISQSRKLSVKPLFYEISKKVACMIHHFIRKIFTYSFIEEKISSVKCGFLLGSAQEYFRHRPSVQGGIAEIIKPSRWVWVVVIVNIIILLHVKCACCRVDLCRARAGWILRSHDLHRLDLGLPKSRTCQAQQDYIFSFRLVIFMFSEFIWVTCGEYSSNLIRHSLRQCVMR